MTAAQPFFSVIIPVYNRAAVLGLAIASVLGQTCQDFEIVIVDDGSTDDPAAIVAAIGDPRLRFITQANGGGGKARNTAIDAACGRYIAPLDSDDIFLPHHLESMKAMLDGTTNTAGYARIIVDRGQGRSFLKPPRALRSDEDMGEYLLCARGFVPTITLVVERKLASRIRYNTDLRAAEDTDFAIRLALAGCKFRMTEQPGAVWMDIPDPDRTSAGGGKTTRFESWLREMRPVLTNKAYHGGRGWAFAKMMARGGHRGMALRCYLGAVLRGCYAPHLAAIIFLQIFLDARHYRAAADLAISWLRLGPRVAAPGPRKPDALKPDALKPESGGIRLERA